MLERTAVATRMHAAHDRLAATRTLLEAAPHMPVADAVAARLERARSALAAARSSSVGGRARDHAETAASVRRAAAAAEAAVFDASLLPLLFFPDHHTAIVFASFFAPVVLPIAMAVVKHVRARRQLAATAAVGTVAA